MVVDGHVHVNVHSVYLCVRLCVYGEEGDLSECLICSDGRVGLCLGRLGVSLRRIVFECGG